MYARARLTYISKSIETEVSDISLGEVFDRNLDARKRII